MKRKNILVVFMIAIMMLSGCGSQNTEANIDFSNNGSNVEQSTKIPENSVEESQEETANKFEIEDVNSLITEKTDDELDLKQFFYSYEDRTMDREGKQVFRENLFESIPDNFVTTDNVDIYNINGIRVGYTLKNVEIDPFGEYDGWYYFYLDGNKRFARVEDVTAKSKLKEQVNVEQTAQEETNKQEQSTAKTENPVGNISSEQPVQDTPAVTEPVEETPTSNKYTPEEAIAVYRSLMEAGGIVWNPGLKDVTSWGTGWIYLDKGYAELVASSNLESFAMGDSVGNPWTEYYLEVTSSDNEAVYFTEWHN